MTLKEITKAKTYKNKVTNQLDYEKQKAREILPEVLYKIIECASEELKYFCSIPEMSPELVRSKYNFTEFYRHFYFYELHHIAPEDAKEEVLTGFRDSVEYQKMMNESSLFYYLRYLFEDKKLREEITKGLKERGFNVLYSDVECYTYLGDDKTFETNIFSDKEREENAISYTNFFDVSWENSK